MPYPSWLGYLFASALIVVGAYCLGRLLGLLILDHRDEADVASAHVLMAFAMVGMLVPKWNVVAVGGWQLAFAALALWFGAGALRVMFRTGISLSSSAGQHLRHYLIHAVMACTMLYMYWLGMPLRNRPGLSHLAPTMSGPPTGAGDPGLTLLLIVVLLASAVWQLDGIARTTHRRAATVPAAGGHGQIVASPSTDPDRHPDAATVPPWLAPQYAAGCHIMMCVAMAYALVLMV